MRVREKNLCDELRAGGVESPARELRLLADFLGAGNKYGGQEIEKLVARRAQGEPLAVILGRRGFWQDEFLVEKGVLSPRPESEHLVEEAFALFENPPYKDAPIEVVEFGLGSGAVLLSILTCQKEKGIRGIGIEKDASAVAVAKQNAERLGVRLGVKNELEILHEDWGNWESPQVKAGVVRLAIANPPYLTTSELQRAPPEVREWESASALDGGADGLASYRGLVVPLAKTLSAGERALVEITPLRVQEITDCLTEQNYFVVERVVVDLGGNERVLVLKKQ